MDKAREAPRTHMPTNRENSFPYLSVEIKSGYFTARDRLCAEVRLATETPQRGNKFYKFYKLVFFSVFIQFFSLTSSTTVGLEGYCCTSSQSLTHTHTLKDSSGRGIGPSKSPLPDNTQHSQDKDIRAPGWIRTRNPSKRAAADQRRRPRGHWDRLS